MLLLKSAGRQAGWKRRSGRLYLRKRHKRRSKEGGDVASDEAA